MAQARMRIHGTTTIPDRVVSVFDPAARPIRRGKLSMKTDGEGLGMLTMSPVSRDERRQLFQMVDQYLRQIRPTGDHFANDPHARSKYFDDEFWNEIADRFLWWAKLDDVVIGFAKVELVADPVWEKLGYIDDFYIAPPFRRQGHGRAFAAMIYDWFAQKGIKYMRLYVRVDNPKALVFWEKEGFETVRYQMRKMLR
jgi:ribosomal protein S18 acetylase RimI-like enzyme